MTIGTEPVIITGFNPVRLTTSGPGRTWGTSTGPFRDGVDYTPGSLS